MYIRILATLLIPITQARTCADQAIACSIYVSEYDPNCQHKSTRKQCPKSCGICTSSNNDWSNYLDTLVDYFDTVFVYDPFQNYVDYYEDIAEYFNSNDDYQDYLMARGFDPSDHQEPSDQQETCKNEVSDHICNKHLKKSPDLCEDPEIIKTCQKSCGICDKKELLEKCQDLNEFCDKSLCYLSLVENSCPLTCGLCKNPRSVGKEKKEYVVDSKVEVPAEILRLNPKLKKGRKYLKQGTCSEIPIFEEMGSLFSTQSLKKIVGGNPANKGTHPWIISIFLKGTQNCGGSLISEYWVVTAAHCLVGEKKSSLTMVAGDYNILTKNPHEQRRNVISMLKYPKYYKKADDHDIGLMKADQPFIFTTRVQPICLPAWKSYPNGNHDNQIMKCKIAGWGDTLIKSSAKIIQEAEIRTFSTEKCKSVYEKEFWYTNNMICAGKKAGGVDTCSGDSGGPLICESLETGVLELTGVTSWGEGCAMKGWPGVYVKVSNYILWISEATGIPIGDARF